MKFKILMLLLIIPVIIFSQKAIDESKLPYLSVLKLNLSSIIADGENSSVRLAFEQRLFKNNTIQLEFGKTFNGSSFIFSPQLRHYFYMADAQTKNYYLGLGYLYKENEYNVSDSVKRTGNFPYNFRQFTISKYINAFTVTGGCLFKWYVFNKKHFVLTDFNLGLGLRFKKSNRYGIASDEEIDLREAFVIRPQYYQDTNGRSIEYLELNAIFRIMLPVFK